MSNKIKIVAIGAGNIANHLIPALHKIPVQIEQVYSRKINNARKLSSKVDAEAINNLSDINPEAHLYILMVPDDDISDVVAELPRLNETQYLVHTSGSQKIRVLNKASSNYGSFYPLQSFNKAEQTELATTPFLIDGNNPKIIRMLRSLARKISPKVISCTDQERLNYHLSAVFINNFINHLSCISKELLHKNNLDPSILEPISKSTFNKILESNPCKIQTGPAIRKDIKLHKQHLQLIKHNEEWSKIYKAISKSIIKRYHEDS